MSTISSLSGNSFWQGLGKEFDICFPTLVAPCIQISFPQNLEVNQNVLVNKLLPIASQAFSVEITPEFRADVRTHILGSQNLLIVFDRATTKPIAFRVWDNIDLGRVGLISYLSGMCILPEWQGRGFGKILIQRIYKEGISLTDNTLFMILRTQNPRMQKCFSDVMGSNGGTLHLFGDRKIPLDVRYALAATAMHIQDSKVNLEELVSRKTYLDGALYGEDYDVVKISKGTNFNDLDQYAGDAAYCIWKSR